MHTGVVEAAANVVQAVLATTTTPSARQDLDVHRVAALHLLGGPISLGAIVCRVAVGTHAIASTPLAWQCVPRACQLVAAGAGGGLLLEVGPAGAVGHTRGHSALLADHGVDGGGVHHAWHGAGAGLLALIHAGLVSAGLGGRAPGGGRRLAGGGVLGGAI